jgi:hypothetical protein
MLFRDAHAVVSRELAATHDVRPGVTVTRHRHLATGLHRVTQGSTGWDQVVQAAVLSNEREKGKDCTNAGEGNMEIRLANGQRLIT